MARELELLAKEYAKNPVTVIRTNLNLYQTPISTVAAQFLKQVATAALKEIFPHASVTGTELLTSTQAKLAIKLGKKAKFKVVASHLRQKVDLVFASEYFEHFERPVEHLEDVIQKLKPTYWIIANSFGTDAIGHFQTYRHNDEFYDSREISRLFSQTMKTYGYDKVKTNCWNNRPAYWKLSQLEQ